MSNRQPLGITFNADQLRAEVEVMASIEARQHHCLTGHGGSGKTTFVQVVAYKLFRKKIDVVLTAPTHKAVAVLRRKLRDAGLDIQCVTIQSLLSLKPKQVGDRQIFTRDVNAKPVSAAVVIVDEASMVSEDLMAHIEQHLQGRAVLFVGDSAQLPPVGEDHSRSFDTQQCSHLDTIIRQGAGNPILDAADNLRRQQGGSMDWSWVRPAMAKPFGVYCPGDRSDVWLKKAFLSTEFKGDTDTFRYLCWTNKRVAEVNAKVREWIYDRVPESPFLPGERCLLRAPVIKDKAILLNTNEEATVQSIEPVDGLVKFPRKGGKGPEEVIMAWRMKVVTDEGLSTEIEIVRDEKKYLAIEAGIKGAARFDGGRWRDYHHLREHFAQCQAIYASTVHTSQGSTHKWVFLDIPEMRRWARANALEAQRGMYVAITRPTHAAVLVGT
jgi:energy-coupling factor transporter ATP-binding protein EcfA2